MKDIFKVIIEEGNIHPFFNQLLSDDSFYSAKQVILEISKEFQDIDGNFIKEFQSKNGFDARLWELYLYAFLKEQNFIIDRQHQHSPDFLFEKDSKHFALEAVTINRKHNDYFSPNTISPKEIIKLNKNDMPLRFASALTSKLNKKYWNLPHVKGKPFILAVADFSENFSMSYSANALSDYLYGYRYDYSIDTIGNIIVDKETIDCYRKKSGSVVSANFFDIPGTENISAIISSPIATLSKFNRIGMQHGYYKNNIKILCTMSCYNNTKVATPIIKQYFVDTTSTETWSDGITMYLNPKAKYKIPIKLFNDDVSFIISVNGDIKYKTKNGHPFNANNVILNIK